MFDTVAQRYDLTNDVLSAGQDRRWRREVVDALDLTIGDRVLDLAAGTGTSSQALHAMGADVVAADFSLGMLAAGRPSRTHLPFVAADALHLPFADEVFDAATISFGLRNLVSVPDGLAEMARVVRPGGTLVVAEFSHPTNPTFRTVYESYLMRALPGIARRVSSAPDAYVYLAESIQDWPDQPTLAGIIGSAGWQDVQWRNLTGGIVALHRATRSKA
jgi:demethylmenaquinone methyltransferase / 2-methoxy-6-polyprenyl-1,4-benzoquinol methylase